MTKRHRAGLKNRTLLRRPLGSARITRAGYWTDDEILARRLGSVRAPPSDRAPARGAP
jgi:hypothetical protein